MHTEGNFVANIYYHSYYYDLESNNLKTRQMVQWVKFVSMNLTTRVQNLQMHIKTVKVVQVCKHSPGRQTQGLHWRLLASQCS